jgi:hypothetical protein
MCVHYVIGLGICSLVVPRDLVKLKFKQIFQPHFFQEILL